MVMETPSPQCVGREFVRQYYTLLNEAPLHLHRFYSNDSSFVHGGWDTPEKEANPVCGQQEIHRKIMQLNFRDCHAKIRLVDSHATLGNGVVVQVTGELSNNGQPMRRFMQTFVLAPQSPKKYYVHNDIFRYQDEVFSDVEPEQEQESVRSEPEEEMDAPEGNHNSELQDTGINYYARPALTMNGNVLPEDPPIPVVPQPPVVTPVTPTTPAQPPPSTSPPPASIPEEPKEPVIVPVEENDKIPEPVEEIQQEPVSSEPKTYANLVKTGGAFGGNPASTGFTNTSMTSSSAFIGSKPSTSPVSSGQVLPESQTSSSHIPPRVESKESTPVNVGYSGQSLRPPRPRGNLPRSNTRDRGLSGRSNMDDIGDMLPGSYRSNIANDGEKRRPGPNVHYTDTQQLFVGNLPHNATEGDLKHLFSQYGTVLDVRINSKPNAKTATGGRVPNFGFVTFEEVTSVQEVLSNRPILFQNEFRLNVEEKKTKGRDDRRTGPGDMNRALPGRGGGGGGGLARGGPGGPGRGSRSGPSNFSNRMNINRSGYKR